MRALIWIFSTLLACAVAEKKIVCYWASRSVYNKGDEYFDTSNIDSTLCTHLLYAFAGLDSNGTITILDRAADLPDNNGRDGYNLFNQLRVKNPSLKTMISIGGWNQGSVNFSRMVTNAELRKFFVLAAVDFVRKYKFNGLDLDWEYPAQRGGAATDVENFVLLLKELREAFDKEGFLLSAAVAAAFTSASKSYDIPNIAKYLDFINLMSYNFHGIWKNVTGNHAPLYAASWEQDNKLFFNVNASVHYWLSKGTPAEKLIVGVKLYGHGYILANVSNTVVGAPVSGSGISGSYNKICKMLTTEKWTINFSKQHEVPYAFKGNQWISYANVGSVREKAQYIRRLGLGGAMVWSIHMDDFRGMCGNKNYLLQTLNEVLRTPS